MLLYLIMAAVFGALKLQGPQQQGKEEGCGIGIRKSYFSRFILIMLHQIVVHIMLA
jgi:hypothetical protein